MLADPSDVTTLEDPQRVLELAFIHDFLRTHGYDSAKLRDLSPQQIDVVMTQAAIYASGRLSEVEARAHFVHDLHSTEPTGKLPHR